MDQLDTRTNIKLVLEQERKWMDILRTACVTPKGNGLIGYEARHTYC